MAFKKKYFIPPETKVELVATRKEQVFKKEMAYSEALGAKRKKGWSYRIYQLGFSQYNSKP